MSIERKLCEGMGYDSCILFSSARVAVANYVWMMLGALRPIFIPSNVCPSLLNAIGPNAVLLPVDRASGFPNPSGPVNVQLYGYRREYSCELEIDPLMSAWGRKPIARASIISFGYSKTIDIGYGGALLMRSGTDAADIEQLSDWDSDRSEFLERELDRLDENIERRKERREWWKKYLPTLCVEPLVGSQQFIPWRVIRRIPEKRDDVVKALRDAGFDAGTNYPPLPGVTDPSAVQWGKEVINLWVTDDYDESRIKGACEIIKRAIDGVKYDEDDILSTQPYRVVRQL